MAAVPLAAHRCWQQLPSKMRPVFPDHQGSLSGEGLDLFCQELLQDVAGGHPCEQRMLWNMLPPVLGRWSDERGQVPTCIRLQIKTNECVPKVGEGLHVSFIEAPVGEGLHGYKLFW